MPNYQGVWSLTVQMQNRTGWPTRFQPRGLFFGGEPSSGQRSDTIDFVDITTTGNATDFGDLSVAKYALTSVSSFSRAVAAAGNEGGNAINVIEYVTIANTGNVTDFGDLTATAQESVGTGNDTRGLISLGASGGASDTIDYITIASTGNAQDFGNLTVA